MTEKIKACPFCNGEAKLYKSECTFYPRDIRYRIACDKCYAMTNLFKTEQEVCNAWNRRACENA